MKNQEKSRTYLEIHAIWKKLKWLDYSTSGDSINENIKEASRVLKEALDVLKKEIED